MQTFHSNRTTSFYTLLGFLAIFLWSMSALFAIYLKTIPTFEILAIAFSVCFFFTLIKLIYTQQWHTIKQPFIVWLIGVMGIFGTEACFVSAFKFAPPAQVVLLFHTWPIMVFAISALLHKETFTLKHLLACMISLLGISLILTAQPGLGFAMHFTKGYMLAFLGAIIWGIYIISLRKIKMSRSESVSLYLGMCALLSALAHVSFETFMVPTLQQWLIILAMGLTSQGLAYILWNTAIKNGNYKLLYLLAYTNPILANILLVLFGFTQFSIKLVFACALIVISNALA